MQQHEKGRSCVSRFRIFLKIEHLYTCNAACTEEGRHEMDSSDDDISLDEEEPLIDRRAKRKKKMPSSTAPGRLAATGPPPPPSSDPYAQPAFTWIPGQYVPSQRQPRGTWTGAIPPPPGGPWSSTIPPPAGGAWGGSVAPLAAPYGLQSAQCEGQYAGFLNPEQGERYSRRKRKNEYDLGRRERSTSGRKPNRVVVLPGGEVDASCKGKNAWDEALRDLVPKCLDMSVVNWKSHQPHTLKKLRASLDSEFEYLGGQLSMVGFRTAVTRFMKSERSRLKLRYLKGIDSPPEHIDKPEWDRLKQYWDTDAQKVKAQKMAKARTFVKNYTQVGRKGKARRESLSVSVPLAPGTSLSCVVFFLSLISLCSAICM